MNETIPLINYDNQGILSIELAARDYVLDDYFGIYWAESHNIKVC